MNSPSSIYASVEHTPLGLISVVMSNLGLTQVLFGPPPAPAAPLTDLAHTVLVQIDEYLRGDRKDFSFPIDWSYMPAFQRAVLKLTLDIPYGEIRTYQQIANQLGKPGAARAVGQAEANNPMPLVIPCHRVVGSDGRMHGYGGAGGIPTKIQLLKMEGHSFPEEQLSLF